MKMKTLNFIQIVFCLCLFELLYSCQKDQSDLRSISTFKDDPIVESIDTSQLRQGLVAYYPFRGDVLDHSGNNHNSSVVGTVSFGRNHLGKRNSSLNLGSGYVVTDQFFNFERSDSFSVAMWFKLNTSSSGGRLISTECPEGNFRIAAGDNGAYAFQFGNYIWDTVALNTWNYIVYTYDQRRVRIYKNDTLMYKGY